MATFADVLEDLVRNHGLTNVRWAEVGNEPNSGGVNSVSLAEYDVLVRNLDEQLQARGLRPHPPHGPRPGRERRRPDADARLDAVDRSQHGRRPRRLGQHVYWFYNDTGRLEYRLRDIWHLLNEVIRPSSASRRT